MQSESNRLSAPRLLPIVSLAENSSSSTAAARSEISRLRRRGTKTDPRLQRLDLRGPRTEAKRRKRCVMPARMIGTSLRFPDYDCAA